MFKGPQQVELLQRLAEAMGMLAGECQAEGCDLDLAGLHILICSKTALDSLGTLCLDAQVTDAVEVGSCVQKQQHATCNAMTQLLPSS